MKYAILVSLFILAGCKTVESGAQSVCARKAEIIGAAQAVIDTLNTQCPLIEENIEVN